MPKKKWIIRIVSIVVIGSILIGLAVSTMEPRNDLTAVEKGLRIVASPFQHGISAVSGEIKGFFSSIADAKRLQEENVILKQQIGELNNQINTLKASEVENIRLREMLNYKEKQAGSFELTVATIIAENNNNLQHTITLNRGASDGIQNDMIVLNHRGLIGRVTSVMSTTCEVVLILDREGAVGARVWETRETPGVVEGMGSEKNLLRMIHMPHDADICVGDTIVTSGLDGIYPAGIRIGEVTEITMEAGGLTKQATVEPYVNFSKLEEVFILTRTTENYQAGFAADTLGQEE